jgi:DNA (cytosine-5)-methyltransferase 1
MEQWAHRTLALRSFFHHFPRGKAPAEYYGYLRREITQNELFESFPEAAEVDRRIRCALKSADLWVLCVGPPCQAFSVVGRSRNGGIADDDHRVYLYRQYLRILSVHEPPLFIMENVKGLLSSKVKGDEIFEQMLEDLGHPAELRRSLSTF